MGSLVEMLGRKGILPSEFGLWEQIRERQAAYEWIAPNPLESMQFAMADEAQKLMARRRLDDAIQTACDKLGLVRDYPTVEEGQPVPPPPNGGKYYQDWYGNIANMVVVARNTNASTNG